MADKAIFLTERDRDVLAKLIQAELRRLGNVPNRPAVPEEQGGAPEVYVALTPSTGIPANNFAAGAGTGSGSGFGEGDQPGEADCTIYRILPYDDDTHEMVKVTGLTRRVYNLAPGPVAGNQWITVVRDKFGSWMTLDHGLGDVLAIPICTEPKFGTLPFTILIDPCHDCDAGTPDGFTMTSGSYTGVASNGSDKFAVDNLVANQSQRCTWVGESIGFSAFNLWFAEGVWNLRWNYSDGLDLWTVDWYAETLSSCGSTTFTPSAGWSTGYPEEIYLEGTGGSCTGTGTGPFEETDQVVVGIKTKYQLRQLPASMTTVGDPYCNEDEVCYCEESEGVPAVGACIPPPCAVIPVRYRITVPSASGSGCANCADLAGTHDLTYTDPGPGQYCYWTKVVDTGTGTGSNDCNLAYILTVQADSSSPNGITGILEWTSGSSSGFGNGFFRCRNWQCLGSNTFTDYVAGGSTNCLPAHPITAVAL